MNKVLLILIISIMMSPVFSQDLPETDRISTKAGDLELSFIGHGSLMFRINDFVIHVDPVKSSGSYAGLPQADLILVTHEHYDHLDTELLRTLKKEGTVMYCNEASLQQIPWAKAMKQGDVRKVQEITIEALPAYNIIHERSKGQPFHPKGVGLGYILTIGGKRVYVAGDTENNPEMKALKDIDIAFLPMNLPYTMTPDMVADAALAFKPAILYPYHYGETRTGELVELLKDSGIDVRIRDLK
jgi:L-ascorbate metabolism protein UlaG (beta-lactamase superfamily)